MISSHLRCAWLFTPRTSDRDMILEIPRRINRNSSVTYDSRSTCWHMVSSYSTTRRDMQIHNTAEPDSCTGAAPPPGARRFTVSYHSARPGAGVRAWSVTITSPPSRRWCTSWGPPRDRAGWPRAARRASWRAARRQAAAPPRAPVWRGGRRGEHSHAAAPPPAAAPPRAHLFAQLLGSREDAHHVALG